MCDYDGNYRKYANSERRQISSSDVTFYWLIGKLLLSSFIPSLNFLKNSKNW